MSHLVIASYRDIRGRGEPRTFGQDHGLRLSVPGSNESPGMSGVLLVCDNRDVPNWGCRATSIALDAMLDARWGVTARIGRKEVLHKESRFSSFSRNAGAMKRNPITAAFHASLVHRSDYVTGDISACAELVLKQSGRNAFFASLVERIQQADMVVVNGEGSMIFKPVERRDLRFQLLCLELGRRLAKPTFYVNAMISDYPGAPRPHATWMKCKAQLSACQGVQVRDLKSLELLETMDLATRTLALPDALFSLAGSRFIGGEHPADLPNHMLAPFPENPERLEWMFGQPYICVSGSSYFRSQAGFAETRPFFLGLAETIRRHGRKPVFVATCTGDKFLEPLAREAGALFVPVETNVFIGAAILGSADAFISGRYHPTILATLGGTPCVALESNSHKMASLQLWLDRKASELRYRDHSVLEKIEQQLDAILAQGNALRDALKTKAGDLGRLAKNLPDWIGAALPADAVTSE